MECNGSWLVYFPLIGIPRARWYTRGAELECWCINAWMINRGWPPWVDNDGLTPQPSVRSIKTVFATTIMGKWSRMSFSLLCADSENVTWDPDSGVWPLLAKLPMQIYKEVQLCNANLKCKYEMQIQSEKKELKYQMQTRNGILDT